MRSVLLVGSVLVATALIAGCASSAWNWGADAVFESVSFDERACPEESGDGVDCLIVTAPVVGDGPDTGECVVYADGDGRNMFTAAESGELAMEPGQTVEWEVEVTPPDDPEFEGWNPICTPMVEG